MKREYRVTDVLPISHQTLRLCNKDHPVDAV